MADFHVYFVYFQLDAKGTCYIYKAPETRSWFDSETECRKDGAFLASMESHQEWRDVVELINHSDSVWTWIGLAKMEPKGETALSYMLLYQNVFILSQMFSSTFAILFYSRLCSSTAGSSPPPESSIFLCPLLSSSIPLLVAPECHLSNDVFGLPTDLTPSVCHSVLLIVHLLSFIRAMCPFVLVTYWTMSVTLVLCLMVVLRILSFSLTLSILLSIARWLVSSFFTNDFVKDHI